MTSVILTNNNYIKQWQILKQSIKSRVVLYDYRNDLSNNNVKALKSLRNISHFGLLWDNVNDNCFIPFYDTVKIKPKNKSVEIPKQNSTRRVRLSKYFYGTRKHCKHHRLINNKKYTVNNSNKVFNKITIKGSTKQWTNNDNDLKVRKEKHEAILKKRISKIHEYLKQYECNYSDIFKYFSSTLRDIFKNLSVKNPNIIIDLISCNMNKPEFISETKLLEKELKITIRFSYDETGNRKTTMGDWIQEYHNESIKTLYFNENINLWNSTLSNHEITAPDDNNDYTLTISGGTYYITNVLDATITSMNTIPTINYNSVADVTIKGFIDCSFQTASNTTLNITGLDFTGLECIRCDFSGITVQDCSFVNTIISDTSFNEMTMNNTEFGYYDRGNNYFGDETDRTHLSLFETNVYRSYIIGPGAYLKNLDLSNQTLENVNFLNANLDNVTLPKYRLDGSRLVGFLNTPNITNTTDYKLLVSGGTNIITGPRLDIRNVNFSSKNLSGNNFTDCDFDGVNLNSSTLTGAIFSNTIGGPFVAGSGTLPTLPDNFAIFRNSGGNNYLIGSDMSIRNTDFQTYTFNNIVISNIDLSGSLLTNVSFNNSVINMKVNTIPYNIPVDCSVIGQNIYGPGLLLGIGPYQNINFDSTIDLTGQNVSNTIFNNCKIGPITNVNKIPTLNPDTQATLFNNPNYFVYGENLNVTSLDFTSIDLTDKTLRGANIHNSDFSNITIYNTKLFDLIGTPINIPIDYTYKLNDRAFIGKNLNYENMTVYNNNFFKLGNLFYDIEGVTSKHMTWNNYNSISHYNTANALLPSEMKFVDGMIIGQKANLKNTKVVRLKKDLTLNKAIKYTFKSIIHVQKPFKFKMDMTVADISFVVRSDSNVPGQFIAETDISQNGWVTGIKSAFDLSYVINSPNAHMKNRNLVELDLTDIIVNDTDFTGSNLTNVDLSNRDLTNSIFVDCNLTGVDFSGSDLSNVTISNCVFSSTNFTGCDISTAKIDANMNNTIIILKDNASQTLPSNVTFTPSGSFNTDGTGTIQVSTFTVPQIIEIFNESITDVLPSNILYIDFSYNNTKFTTAGDISFEIVNSGTHGTLDKPTYYPGEIAKYNVAANATGSDTVQWKINTPEGPTATANIAITYDTKTPVNLAAINNVSLTCELDKTTIINLGGSNILHYKFTSVAIHGIFKIDDNIVQPNLTEILPNDELLYTPSSIGTETLTFKAMGLNGVYSSDKTLTITNTAAIINSVENKTSKDLASAQASTLLTAINNALKPVLNVGSVLADLASGADDTKKRMLSSNFIRNIFSLMSGSNKIFSMNKAQLPLPAILASMFKNNIDIMKPYPNFVYSLPDLSTTSFYCVMETGEEITFDIDGINYTFTQNENTISSNNPINNKTTYIQDEVVTLGPVAFGFGSVGGSGNTAPIFTSTAPTATIEVGATFTYNITTTDTDGHSVTITASTIPDWMTLYDYTDGTALLTGTPLLKDAGLNSVVLNVSDGGSSSNQSFDTLIKVPDIMIWELGDISNTWGNIPGTSTTYHEDSKYFVLKNNDSIAVDMTYYKIGIYDTSSSSVTHSDDISGDFVWVSGTGIYSNYEYAYNTVAQTHTQHEASANLLKSNITSILDTNENDFIINRLNNEASWTAGNTSQNGVWIGLHTLKSSTDFAWFDGGTITFTDWNSGEPDTVDASGALIYPIGGSDWEWIDQNQSTTRPAIYKRYKTALQYNFNNEKGYIPLSGTLSSGNYMLITNTNNTANFISAIGDPAFTSVLHQTFNYDTNFASGSLVLPEGYNGHQTIELIVNNDNDGDYVMDRFGPEPNNGEINTIDWESDLVKRKSSIVEPSNNFAITDWDTTDIPSNSALLTQSTTPFTITGLISSANLKVNGYYPLYKARHHAYNASPASPKSFTSHLLNSSTYYMPGGLVENSTYFLGNYDNIIDVLGYYPLYYNEEAANAASPEIPGTSHTHDLGGTIYYMPDGLVLGSTAFHGTYNDPFHLDGYKPVYRTEAAAEAAAQDDPKTARSVTIFSNTYYMPNGLTTNVYYDGSYKNPIEINGYYPLYYEEIYAKNNSQSTPQSAHTHVFNSVTYWMPDGITIFHGNYISIPCLTEHTHIKTPSGYKKITTLEKYDTIVTQDGRHVPITKLTKSKITTDPYNSPYVIPKNYFGKGYPKKEFLISPTHAVSIDHKANKWFLPYIHGKLLRRHDYYKPITYYHIELPNWLTDHLVINGGTIVESLGDAYHKKLEMPNPYYLECRNGYYKRDNRFYSERIRKIRNMITKRITE
jgi:uncharacterized protein YjbI with pentapeptide repeats